MTLKSNKFLRLGLHLVSKITIFCAEMYQFLHQKGVHEHEAFRDGSYERKHPVHI